MTGDEAVYSHAWRPGDVIVWDERAAPHRGRPWPYDEPRTLASICVTARDRDGLPSVRPE
jgi:alpha-ketoglutarate-dependent 2,4-dichlorophenoxyacetate dioxygenase